MRLGGLSAVMSAAAQMSIRRDHDEQRTRLLDQLKAYLGPEILGFLAENDVIEIILNADGTLWVERLGCAMACFGKMAPHQGRVILDSIAGLVGTILTSENPILECEFPIDDSRFEALIPPVVRAPTFALRMKPGRIFTLDDYETSGALSGSQRQVIVGAIRDHLNILVVGGTGSGKTTLTNAILHAMSVETPEDRIVIIEDTAELMCAASNHQMLRATAAVSMLKLLKVTMRLRPDRIVVGEVRGEEALALLKAWNTGHPGGVATVHANGGRAGLLRMQSLVSEATVAPMQEMIATAINLVVVIAKTPEGRRIREILRVTGYRDGDYLTQAVEG